MSPTSVTFARCPVQARAAVLGVPASSGPGGAQEALMRQEVGPPPPCLLPFPTERWAPTTLPPSLCSWLVCPPGDGLL